jgi:hypothetical protein
VPRIKLEKVGVFIEKAENPAPVENLQATIERHSKMMPSVNGPKAHSISNIIRDIPEENSVGFCQFTESTGFGGIPEKGISSDSELAEEELGKNYCFIPNFIRPSPDCIEEDECFGDLSVDVAQDVSNI